jgi:hypothetical protein
VSVGFREGYERYRAEWEKRRNNPPPPSALIPPPIGGGGILVWMNRVLMVRKRTTMRTEEKEKEKERNEQSGGVMTDGDEKIKSSGSRRPSRDISPLRNVGMDSSETTGDDHG